MAEQVFATMGEYGMSLSTITGAKGSLGNLFLRGTQFISGDTNPRRLEYNYENQLMYSGTDHAVRRGLNLAIFDLNMKLVFMATYDVYSDVNAIKNLSDKMRSVTKSQLAVITSRDAIASDTTLDGTFDYFRSHAWPKTEYFNKGTEYKRTSYACVICGKKQAIIAEKFVGRGVPYTHADIEISFEDPTTIGFSGFGNPIITDEEIYENTGSSNIVKSWLSATPLSTHKLKVGDSFLFKSLGETDAVAASANSFLEYEIIYHNSTGAEVGKQIRRVSCVEGWQEIEIRDKIPTGCASLTVQAVRKTTREAPRSPQGTVYVKNTVMQLSDNDRAQATQVSIGLYGTSVKSYEDSLGSFGHYDPSGYFQSAISESNHIRNSKIPQQTIEPVRWMDRVLDEDFERLVIKTTGDFRSESVKFAIDPTKFYYVCVWVNKQYKEAGKFMLGLRQFTSGGSMLDMKSTDGRTTNKYMYSQWPEFDMLEDRQWYLLQGFILPHNVNQDKANEFIEANKEFYGWDDLYGNGIGISDEGNGYYGWISNKDVSNGAIQFLDYYNNGKESKSLWALPIVRELSIGSIDIDDGVLTSINLTG
ncbi:MAG: hypothetical protein ACRC9Y_08190 [Aeromonas veronii]